MLTASLDPTFFRGRIRRKTGELGKDLSPGASKVKYGWPAWRASVAVFLACITVAKAAIAETAPPMADIADQKFGLSISSCIMGFVLCRLT